MDAVAVSLAHESKSGGRLEVLQLPAVGGLVVREAEEVKDVRATLKQVAKAAEARRVPVEWV